MRQATQSHDAQPQPAAADRKGRGLPSATSGFQAFVDRSPRMLAQRRSIDVLGAKGADPSATWSSVDNRGGPLQRFKDAATDDADVTEEQIASADLRKLEDWFNRTAADDAEWDDPTLELIPDAAEKLLIEQRIRALGSAARKESARQRRLLELDVSEAELQLFETTTTEDTLIREAAAHMKASGWSILTTLTNLSGASVEARKIALSVCAKGEVTSPTAVIDLAVDWAKFDSRDDIVVTDLIRLIGQQAITWKGGTYKVPSLTGTEDKAFTFYANGKTPYRIDPEWHVHTTLREGAAKPGFKRQADKTNTGPGTRRDANRSETEAMQKAGFV